jgi:phosphoserine phosphatase RsbU/P
MTGSTQRQWLDEVGHVLETLNQGVIINDDRNCVAFANSTFLEMIKMRREELLGRAVIELFPPADVARLLEFIGRRETEGRARYEFYIPRADGQHLPVAVTARQIQGSDGREYSVVTATDISEQKRAEMELRHANALLQARQRQIEEELQLAERVQQSLVPKSLTWGGISIETYYQPVSSIGGDYGIVRPTGDHLDVLVCDVSGHGISSALIANRIYSETMAQIERDMELSSVLQNLNHFVVQNLAGSAFYFTLAALRFNRDHRSLQFVGAGHPPGMMARRDEAPRLLESTNTILGLFDNAIDSQAPTQMPIRSGDRVLIYTDGLTENFNSQGEMLGVNGLRTIVGDACHLPISEMKQQILDRVAAWRSGPASDDISLVLVEIL